MSTFIYTRREPRNTTLYKTLSAHSEGYFAELESRGESIPAYVRKEFESYLKCGILCFGFARIGCAPCKKELLLAFSCKRRGFCPSCAGRRQAELEIRLVDEMFCKRDVRQYVLSLPPEIRYWFASNTKLSSKAHRIMSEEVESFIVKKSQKPLSRTGSVSVIQRFDSSLALNFHIHSIALDGVMSRKSTGKEKFSTIPAPTDEDIESLVKRIAERLLRYLEKQGYLLRDGFSDEQPSDKLFEETPWLATTMKASTRYLIAHGPRAGKPLRKIGEHSNPSEFTPTTKSTRCAEYRGFSLHANAVARTEESARRLVSYVSRPPIAQGKLKELENGDLLFEMKRTFSNGCSAIRFSPYELLDKIAAIIPRPRAHLTHRNMGKSIIVINRK